MNFHLGRTGGLELVSENHSSRKDITFVSKANVVLFSLRSRLPLLLLSHYCYIRLQGETSFGCTLKNLSEPANTASPSCDRCQADLEGVLSFAFHKFCDKNFALGTWGLEWIRDLR